MKMSCLCGAVQFEILGSAKYFGFDHCSRCRKATGSAFAAELICNAANFRWIAGSLLVNTYEAPVRISAPGYRRASCTFCGGPVPIVDDREVNVPAGTLDDDPALRPSAHIFVDFKAPWFEITDSLRRFGTKPRPTY